METAILSGVYRLHDYAATMWLTLVERYLHLNGSAPLLTQLVDVLDVFVSLRSSNNFNDTDEASDLSRKPEWITIKDISTEVHELLYRAYRFRQQYSDSDFRLGKGNVTCAGSNSQLTQ